MKKKQRESDDLFAALVDVGVWVALVARGEHDDALGDVGEVTC